MPALKNQRHEMFCQGVATGKDGATAYTEAGFTVKDRITASSAAARLSATVNIRARIDELRGKIEARVVEKTAITMAKVVEELAKIGFANMADYTRTTESGDIYADFKDLTREQAAAIGEVTIEEFKVGRGETARDVKSTKFKLLDKRAALVDIGRHLGGFVERKEIKMRVSDLTDAQLKEMLDELDSNSTG